MSRVVDKRRVLGEKEKLRFWKMMRQMEGFSGCEILTYCLMGNHFHLLIRVPSTPSEISKEEIFVRMRRAYPKEKVEQFKTMIEKYDGRGDDILIEEALNKYRRRMFDLSEFMKSLKQRFTQWYNKEYEREGTLWEQRYKCYLIGGSFGSLLRVAAYIDLNPVRAGLVENYSDYQWSGASEAARGQSAAKNGMKGLLRSCGFQGAYKIAFKEYGKILVDSYSTKKKSTIKKEHTNDGTYFHRLRGFANCLVLGSQEFIEVCLSRIKDKSCIPKMSWNRSKSVESEGFTYFFLRRKRLQINKQL